MTVHQCRSCEGNNLDLFLDLGKTALANRFLRPDQLHDPEPFFPLRVALCCDCGLVQLDKEVAPDLLFKDYVYVSGTSAAIRRHARWLADYLTRKYRVGRQDLVVEVASNDGTVLKEFRWQDLRVLGVEPAANVAALAIDQGIATEVTFFDEQLARIIRSCHGPAQLLLARHVLAHVADLHGFVKGIKELLAPNGVAIFEVPHLAELYENLEFDTIYHEHLCYFSAEVLQTLFTRFDLTVIDIDRLPIHGGSLLVHVAHGGATHDTSPQVARVLKEEAGLNLRSLETWKAFARRVALFREELSQFLDDIAGQGKTLAGYGAPAKSTTLLSYCGIGPDRLPFIVDQNPWKQGLLTPGKKIPIYGPEMLLKSQPDVTLILAWNFAAEILHQQAEYREKGGRFAVPIPAPRFVDAAVSPAVT